MHIQPKTLADGTTRYYLRYWKEGKNKFVPKHLYPDFKTKKQAKDWIANHAAKVGAKLEIQRHTEAMQRVAWRNKYHNFEEYLSIYEKWQKREAANSWKNNMFYLEQYVFRYFLNLKGMNNLNLWYTEFQRFKDWLEDDARITRGRSSSKSKKKTTEKRNKNKSKMNTKNEVISYSTKNHCIRTLNNFLKCMVKYNKMDPTYALKCSSFKQSLVNKNARTYKDVIDEEEYESLKSKLTMSRDFFMVLYHTGMRFNELYSLSIEDLYEGEGTLTPFVLETIKDKLDGKVYGYISLKSQIASKNTRTRNKMGYVQRKPLKGRDTEEDKDGRLIPIHDPEVWDILVECYNVANEEFEKKIHRSKRKKDYFLFDVSPSEIRKEFRKYCDKGFHACRHSKITLTVGKTQSVMFCKLVCGHRGESYQNYLHTYEMWVKKANEQPQKSRFSKSTPQLEIVGSD